jgi:hypothetical protein
MKKRNKLALATPIAIGVATDSLGLWLSVGVAIDIGVGNSSKQKVDKKDDNKF